MTDAWDDVWTRVSPGRSWAKHRIITTLGSVHWERAGDVMDLGCGSGVLAAMVAESFPEAHLWLVDSSRTAIDHARENLEEKDRVRFVHTTFQEIGKGSVDELADQAGTFALVYTDGLLEHFGRTEQAAILRICRSLLAPCGVQVHFVPYRYHPWQLVRPFVIRGIRETPFTRHEHRAVAAAAGLEDELEGHGGISVFPFSASPEQLGEYLGMLQWFALRRRD